MNYEYYKIFYYVGKHKNITKASAELYSSQPAVTRAIQKLESELGCRLFMRNKNGVEFTYEGKVLHEYISIAHSYISKGEEEVKHAIDVETGTIYIGASVTSLHEFLFEFINMFKAKHPKVKLKINTGSNNSTVERLRDGIIDIAFVSTPCNNTKNLRLTTVHTFRDILIAGNNYSYLKNTVLQLKDTSDYPIVSLRHSMQLRQFLDEVFISNNLTFSPEIEADGADLIVPMISNNLGLGFVPQSMAKSAIARNRVFEVPLDYTMPTRQINMIVDPRHPQTRASIEFVDMVNQYLKQQNGNTDNQPY